MIDSNNGNTELLSTAAKESAARVLNEPEIQNYLSKALRIAFMEGVVWMQEKTLRELRSGQSGEEVVANNAH